MILNQSLKMGVKAKHNNIDKGRKNMKSNFKIIPRQRPVIQEIVVNRHDYQRVLYGRETIMTKNDRNYHVGDTLVLKSVDPDESTEIVRTITSVVIDDYPEYVNLGLKR